MKKKLFLAGRLSSNVSASASENSDLETSIHANEILDSFGEVERAVCDSYLELSDISSKSATGIADDSPFHKLLSKLSDSPVEYCQDKVLLSVVRWDDEPRRM